ncbi:hypothetical protein HG536_0G00680 [Torulaspora globosa]|uniref:Uncharacterized protein n=1 Tax=Torulaspora globosa TaxID=48254 RepID=A0A7G3ZL25_9SACH|nr:uncharacterized protein HG536_0G00680 [Torulaspora globosa]QLL34211.1 hypothetical protein HG536_0G00680 [Torulaspora globosa]
MNFSAIYWILSLASLLWPGSLAAVIGIDYGQQNVKAMVVSPRAPLELVLTPEAKRKDISGLAIRKRGDGIERIYGSAVGSLATRFPKNSLLHLKPLLGKTEADEIDIVLYLREHPGVEITATKRASLAISVDGQEYPIEELSAMNIQEIVNRANRLVKEKDSLNSDYVDKLAITVPDFFDQHQRRALLDVGSLTTDNLETVLISDGLSVLLNFVFKQRDFVLGEPQYYIVYDMGAGSTKASLFSILQPANESEPLKIELGGYGFDEHLSGSKFTLDVASLLENKFLEAHKTIRTDILHSNPNALAKLNQAAEKAKLILSANSEASVSIESLIDDIDFRTKVTRQEFEDFIQESVVDLVKPLEDALDRQFWQSHVALKNIQGVILTGGSTRVPAVQQRLISVLGEKKVLKSVNADESAVNGATIRAVKLFNAFKTKAVDIVERSPSDYGLKIMEDETEMIVFPRGSAYPRTKTIEVAQMSNLSKALTLDLYEDGKIFRKVRLLPEVIKKAFPTDECTDGISFNATFSLSQNRLFDLDKVQAICWNGPKAGEGEKDSGKGQSSDQSDRLNDSRDKGRNKKSPTLEFLTEEVPLSHLMHQEKYRLRENIKTLDEKDSERFEFERAKNELEALLYNTRDFITSEDVAETGPKKHLEKLASIIPTYLDWLEDESDGADKADIMSKIAAVNDLKSRVEIYIESLQEPLNAEQFKALLAKADKLSKKINTEREVPHEGLSALNETFSQAGYDIQKEYFKINLPYYLSNPLSSWNDKFEALQKIANATKEKISSDALGKDSREELLELKLSFDQAFIELEQIMELLEKARNYRFRELLSWYQRAEKAKKRKEMKLSSEILKSSSSMAASSSAGVTDSVTGATSTSTSAASSSAGHSSTSNTAPVHDEL